MHGTPSSDELTLPPVHSARFLRRRFLNWFPMGLTYAFLYWGRYNLTQAKGALGDLMTNADFGYIFGAGTLVYAVSLLWTGPLADRLGGRRMILTAVTGSATMNVAMGLLLRQGLLWPGGARLQVPLFGLLYVGNMIFQSMGAVSVIKVNAPWFHVRERGNFGGVLGAMISTGLFFAFDLSTRVIGLSHGKGPGGVDALWWVFFAPAAGLALMWLVEFALLKDRPSQTGHPDFDTGEAQDGEGDRPVPWLKTLGRLFRLSFSSRFPWVAATPLLLFALVEFCTGALRNGVMHWFPIYVRADVARGGLGLGSDHPLTRHWGLSMMVAGIVGAVASGWMSDKLFRSRRAPAVGSLYLLLVLATASMSFVLQLPWGLWAAVMVVSMGVIGTHGLLSGTASADFGGNKAAATAMGIIDACVYLGTALQSVCLGELTMRNWHYWPPFLVPFAVIGLLLCLATWNALPSRQRLAAPAPLPAAEPGVAVAPTGT